MYVCVYSCDYDIVFVIVARVLPVQRVQSAFAPGTVTASRHGIMIYFLPAAPVVPVVYGITIIIERYAYTGTRETSVKYARDGDIARLSP